MPSDRLALLVDEIEREFGVARDVSSRAALFYLQRSYEEGWSVGERDLREVLTRDIRSIRPDVRRVEHVSRYTFEAIRDIDRLGRERVRAVFKTATDDATIDVARLTGLLRSEFFDEVENKRLPIIARTETNRAGNTAKVDRYRSTGVEYHEALTAEDGRVRTFDTSTQDHTAINGQVRKIGEAFSIPRTKRSVYSNDKFPPFDPNCRCTVIPVVPDESQLAKLAVNKGQRLSDWHRTIDAYGHAMTLDLRRTWRSAFERVHGLLVVHGPQALAEARSS